MRLLATLNSFQPFSVLILGDVMLDLYTQGKVQRVSPEAPVPVFLASEEKFLPGGAGNAACNLAAMGGKVCLIGRVGEDSHGQLLRQVLKDQGIDLALLQEKDYQTPVKNRLIASGQQVIRIDREDVKPLSSSLEKECLEHLQALIEGVDVVALSDYGKGFLTRNLTQAVIQLAQEKKIPVIVDPKELDFSKYQGATLIKPNLGEATRAAGLVQEASLEEIANKLLEDSQSRWIMITRSEKGISLFEKGKKETHYPTQQVAVKDVTGAGDTVLAVTTAALANGLSIEKTIELANVAASIAVGQIGCARVTLKDLSRRLFQADSQNKVFDENHLFAVKKALEGHFLTLLGLPHDVELTSQLFRKIKELSLSEGDLIVYLRGQEPSEDLVSLLASLPEIDFLILKEKSFASLCDTLNPHAIFVYEKGEMKECGHHSDLLEG